MSHELSWHGSVATFSSIIVSKTSVLAQDCVIYIGVVPDSVKKWLLML